MLEEGAGLRRGGGRRSMRAGSAAGGRGVGAGTRGGVKPGPLPPRAPMYAFYSLLIYIFYSLFRRDGGAAAATDAENPAQVSGGALSSAGYLLPENGSQVPGR